MVSVKTVGTKGLLTPLNLISEEFNNRTGALSYIIRDLESKEEVDNTEFLQDPLFAKFLRPVAHALDSIGYVLQRYRGETSIRWEEAR